MSEINDSLSDEIKAIIHGYTIALVRVQSDQSKENVFGSGTLVSLHGEYGILTAAHVTEEMSNMYEVQFCITKNRHRFVVKKEHLSVLKVGWPGEITLDGPDLSFVLMPMYMVGTIKAYKSFYPLDHILHYNMTECDFMNTSPYFISGYIGKQTISKTQNGGLTGSHGLQPFIGISESIENYSVRGNYDYCSIPIEYVSNNGNPEDFKGFSGGGLWKGKFYRDVKNELRVDDFILQGVAYYQSQMKCKNRKIICHSHKSISTAASYWQKDIKERGMHDKEN
ncbi:MAG: hypothetical protein JW837_00235 [Sedimentisphaerales bacterium]|nr:hypothetical protein [Sedimentisphaerales bacterium]